MPNQAVRSRLLFLKIKFENFFAYSHVGQPAFSDVDTFNAACPSRPSFKSRMVIPQHSNHRCQVKKSLCNSIHRRVASLLWFFGQQLYISDDGEAVPSPHALQEASVRFGFSLNPLFILLFKTTCEFLRKLNHFACYRAISIIWKQWHQNTVKIPQEFPFKKATCLLLHTVKAYFGSLHLLTWGFL